MLTPPRVLVTGASGFAGSFVARALAQEGHAVVGTYRRETPFLMSLSGVPGLQLARADIADALDLPGPFEAIVHAAATSPVPGVSSERLVHDNVQASRALIATARAWRSRAFILFSTVSVCGEVTAPLLDENTPIVNPSAYGLTKRLAELMLSEADGLPGIALRLPGVLGPGANRNWLSSVADQLLHREPIYAYNLDAPFNNGVHVSDIATLITTLCRRSWEGFDVIVLGARGSTTVRGAIERLAHGLGVPAFIEAQPSEKASFTLSFQRAVSTWAYNPMTIEAVLDRYASEILATRAGAAAC
jgi:UDP-glucose 4-epimerase